MSRYGSLSHGLSNLDRPVSSAGQLKEVAGALGLIVSELAGGCTKESQAMLLQLMLLVADAKMGKSDLGQHLVFPHCRIDGFFKKGERILQTLRKACSRTGWCRLAAPGTRARHVVTASPLCWGYGIEPAISLIGKWLEPDPYIYIYTRIFGPPFGRPRFFRLTFRPRFAKSRNCLRNQTLENN